MNKTTTYTESLYTAYTHTHTGTQQNSTIMAFNSNHFNSADSNQKKKKFDFFESEKVKMGFSLIDFRRNDL